jgi:hypothetical protein
MASNRKLLTAGAAIVALGVSGVAIPQAVGGSSEGDATGPHAERAEQAALKAVGGGRVLGVERNDEGGAWEIEVFKREASLDSSSGDTGRRIEVRLNRNLEWVEAKTDGYGTVEQLQAEDGDGGS